MFNAAASQNSGDVTVCMDILGRTAAPAGVQETCEALAQASSPVAAMVSVTPRLKGSVLELGRVSSSESFRRITELLVRCHCLTSCEFAHS